MEVTYKGKEYKVKYRHVRLTGEKVCKDGSMSEVVLPNGGHTMAYIMLDDDTTLEAFADCSLRDTYCKKLGRIISSGRLRKKLEG